MVFKKIKALGFRNCLKKSSYYLRGLFYRFYFEECAPLQVTGKIYILKRNAHIKMGKCIIWKHVKFDMEGSSKSKPALLEIGDFSTIGDRTEIHVAEKVSIGKRCKISWDCVIMDRNYHGIGQDPEIIKPVTIQDDVWIGCNTIILPGITIGHNSIVGAGSVITKNVSPLTMVAGNPAKIIKRLDGKN
jgi:acetyltransferase-like isoleucine patch superfamily enzyme